MNRRVLIVEDDPDIAEGLRYNLEREGLEARVALTGEQGLQAALDTKSPPSLIILDLMVGDPSTTTRAARLLFVAKHLERIGDYVEDICELTVYMAEASIIKHSN